MPVHINDPDCVTTTFPEHPAELLPLTVTQPG
jgi:hypothetical protein